jgi:hypothetical protein
MPLGHDDQSGSFRSGWGILLLPTLALLVARASGPTSALTGGLAGHVHSADEARPQKLSEDASIDLVGLHLSFRDNAGLEGIGQNNLRYIHGLL